MVKKIRKIVLIIIYVVFSFFYARTPEVNIKGGFSVIWNSFNPETFVMMLFIGGYIVAFWCMINRLFRN